MARVRRAVARTCPRALASQADDIAQLVIVRLLESGRADGGGEPPPTSYLLKVAWTVAVDEIRRRSRRPEVRLEAMPSPVAPEDPERAASSREIGDAITACLGTVAPSRQATVALQLLGHSVPEIAALLGWSGKKTEHLAARGLRDLRACLERKGVIP
ncbi:MAG TPA: sigma factor [Candidatus Polarisedimenticolaceae bacterium]|nr:sigma factor [Candidatus Polarisedimenticolaceae bacterium]